MRYPTLALLLLTITGLAPAQDVEASAWKAESFEGLKFRGIGPAFMSGRIADIAIHPEHDNTWYIGVGSGGVWKTVNAGVTWDSIFEGQGSFSIGCVSIDPNHPDTIWVGTGEDVGGRHIGFGDGVYRSTDGGAHWTHLGLAGSEHITEILLHPDDSKIAWVAAQGPLWNQGPQRGIFKTSDGGQSWRQTLGDEAWTGVASLIMDPRDPNRLYAATWQRHRNVAAYMGGGPDSGLHRSLDGGETWEALSHGLPEGKLGKIGLAISPQNPDVVYAAIELNRREGAIYRSSDRGVTWEKRSDTVSGGTGPHYYQELYASPHRFDRLYLADVRMQVSEDGGATFKRMPEKSKHSDNHALAFRDDDPNYLLVGSDGGLYESFDLAKNWRFIDNLPLTQFYKIAVDDAEPFYNIYGGTQDNSTERGPSRTDNAHGIRNSDWQVVLDWDGHQPATEPGNPNIAYAERQEGHLVRIDMSTGEVLEIQPQAGPDEDYERYNWDAPILVSPHQATRLYFASSRVWRSDNRGDEWTAVSADLTRKQERFSLPIMGADQGWDSPWDVLAMSNYNTITSLAESPLVEGLLYAGTDDGLVQISENGGSSWRRIEVGSMPGVPATAFVNDIKADLFDADTAYVALDNHKYGDYQPYLVKTSDRGQTWQSLSAKLPPRNMIWRLVQDHVAPNLLFLATEFGILVSVDGGADWTQLTGGLPTISFRDLTIHRRDDDLVCASFGRGIYILDDMSVFRSISEDVLAQPGTLFPVRKAWWYFPRPQLGFDGGKGDQGAAFYAAPNPDFGAVFTYYLGEDLETARAQRKASDGDAGDGTSFPGWNTLERERREASPQVWLTVRDALGNIVRRVPGPTTKGFHRVAWDLRFPVPNAVSLVEPPPPTFGGPPRGLPAAPGHYQVTLSSQVAGQVRALSAPQTFQVVPLRQSALPGASLDAVAGFWREYEGEVRRFSALQIALANLLTRTERLQKVLAESRADHDLESKYQSLRGKILILDGELNGNRARQSVGEKTRPTVETRLGAVSRGVERSTYGPTKTHRASLDIAKADLDGLQVRQQALYAELEALIKELIAAGAPWIEGGPLSVGRK